MPPKPGPLLGRLLRHYVSPFPSHPRSRSDRSYRTVCANHSSVGGPTCDRPLAATDSHQRGRTALLHTPRAKKSRAVLRAPYLLYWVGLSSLHRIGACGGWSTMRASRFLAAGASYSPRIVFFLANHRAPAKPYGALSGSARAYALLVLHHVHAVPVCARRFQR
jgi:hypothetical protein